MKIVCDNCGRGFFEIEEREECSDCVHNGAYIESSDGDDWDYIYDEKEIKDNNLERTQAEDEGECRLGTAHDEGCHIYICANCMYETHLPFLRD